MSRVCSNSPVRQRSPFRSCLSRRSRRRKRRATEPGNGRFQAAATPGVVLRAFAGVTLKRGETSLLGHLSLSISPLPRRGIPPALARPRDEISFSSSSTLAPPRRKRA
ncbi:hypothetical protein PUN28_010332 [Cardiocondyla obscurior]|uniref:Uncharacterized protein n=1 Tax=Cardiocondyla obscurior TaxID=286306 RepID=A0AAW2FPS5_9HYME